MTVRPAIHSDIQTAKSTDPDYGLRELFVITQTRLIN